MRELCQNCARHEDHRDRSVHAQTHRRDHTRYLPPVVGDNVLRGFAHRIMHANYRPLLDDP